MGADQDARSQRLTIRQAALRKGIDLIPLGDVMSGLLIGYARVSTEEQDLTA